MNPEYCGVFRSIRKISLNIIFEFVYESYAQMISQLPNSARYLTKLGIRDAPTGQNNYSAPSARESDLLNRHPMGSGLHLPCPDLKTEYL